MNALQNAEPGSVELVDQLNHQIQGRRLRLTNIHLAPECSAIRRFLPFALCLSVTCVAWSQERPNIIVILSDDMGYSDLGCFGGEIRTPNLDRLAATGVRLLQFYNTARCCPTRASWITGLHPHQAGIGWMTETPQNVNHGDFGVDTYRGRLRLDVSTAADMLKAAGYRTMMAGKWHLGLHDPAYWPLQRGFDCFYGILAGASLYFNPGGDRGLQLGNQPVAPEPTREGVRYYTTDAFTDYAIRFLRQADEMGDDQPTFLYLAYTSPHWPLHALPPDIDRYRGCYQRGWDKLRKQRYCRMVKMGLINGSWPLPPRDGPAWDELDDARRREMALKMAIYAAQVDRMDQNIGRLLVALDELGERENTLIFFFNDNGACAEGGTFGSGSDVDLNTWEGWNTSYGRMWAQASNTPFRKYKHWIHEGGIASPALVNWPAGIPVEEHGGCRRQLGYLPDVVPTLADAVGAKLPGPVEGITLLPAIIDDVRLADRAICWEHEGNAAVRIGDWKLVREHAGEDTRWQLYHLARDRTERHDLAAECPCRVAQMRAVWEAWARRVGVLPWNGPGEMRVGHQAEGLFRAAE